MVKNCFFFLLCLSMIAACKTSKTSGLSGFKNDIFGIEDLKCNDVKNPNAIDSQVGNIECAAITFGYDYGLFSNPGPLTPEEEFTRAFDTYHHIRFFEDRMIDPKVYKIFIDSVKIIDVREKVESDRLMFKCDPCNAVAELNFMKETYLYPTTLAEKQLQMTGYTAHFEEKGEFIYKYYQRDGELPGLYIAPKNNRYKTKNTLSIITTESSLDENAINKILQKVYLIK